MRGQMDLFLIIDLLLPVFIGRLATCQNPEETVSPRSGVIGVSDVFRFQNLGEPCLATDSDNWGIYQKYVTLVQQVTLEARDKDSESSTALDEAEVLRQKYGQGRLCHPKFVCVHPGHCECRPGFTFTINNFISGCVVDTGYRCTFLGNYFKCGQGRSCQLSSVVNQKPLEMPEPLNKVVRSQQYDWSQEPPPPYEALCVCDTGSTCQTVTVGQQLELFWSLAPKSSSRAEIADTGTVGVIGPLLLLVVAIS